MTLEVVLFDDVELWATSALRAALGARSEPYTDNVYVSNDLPAEPEDRRDRMVTVRRDGGPRLDPVREQPRLGVNVYGETEQVANDLARMVSALLWASPDGEPVCKVTITSGPSVVPNASQPQRFLTAELITRGTTAP